MESTVNTIEDTILKYSCRGMQDIRAYVSTDCCIKAAEEILSWEKGFVFLTTGFYVAGYAETDGPAGTVVLALALKTLGYHPVIVTDMYCKGFFDDTEAAVEYVDVHATNQELDELVKHYNPVGMISIERCGQNRFGKYANMKGLDISAHTAPIDRLFVNYAGRIPTIGVGDGGNEIGMGKIEGPIRRKLALEPSVVGTDILVIATVSNWGAYGIVTALALLTKIVLMPEFYWIEDYISHTVELGSIDGVTHERVVCVDGKDMTTEQEIVEELRSVV